MADETGGESRGDAAPAIAFTEAATDKLHEVIEGYGRPVAGLRLQIVGRSEGEFQHVLSLVEKGQEHEGDTLVEAGAIPVYLEGRNVPYLDGVTVDYHYKGPNISGLEFINPNPLWLDEASRLIQALFDQQINPSIAAHGGYVNLLGVEDNTAYVELGGGCVGCGMADVTLKQGIEVAIKETVPSIELVVDSTDHASGTNPYFKPGEKVSDTATDARGDMALRVLLVSTYDLGHQPLALASPAAALRSAGHKVRCLDLAVEPPSDECVAWAQLIAVSAPMHTAARLGVAFARGARALNPGAHLCFYGLYAAPLHDLLRAEHPGCSVVGGEPEPALCALADAIVAGTYDPMRPPAGAGAEPRFDRFSHPLPDRAGLPPPARYAHAWFGATLRPAGYVEASRGCAHRCRHCPLTPVYGGRLRLVAAETVLADIEQQIEQGARHITFGDPDFFNAVSHSLGIVAGLHRRHPEVSFDATIKVEHLLQHAALLPQLRDSGCLFVTSAFESCNDEILRLLDKGHTRDDLDRALELARRERLSLRPTWVAFTPWGTVEDFVEMLRFIEDGGLVGFVPPVQYALKLLLPPGSPLIDTLREQGRLGHFDREGLTWTWTNPDARLVRLQAEVARIAESISGDDCRRGTVEQRAFAAVKRAAMHALSGSDAPVSVLPQPADPVPGLTEAWFC